MYLAHHGILGMKWGVRRYQYEDGSLTPEGRKRYGIGDYQKRNGELTKAGKALIKSDKKGFVSREKIRWSGRFRNAGDQIENLKNTAKNITDTRYLIDTKDRAAEISLRNKSFDHKRLSNASRTTLGKRFHDQRSANADYLADYFETRQNLSLGKKIVDDFTGYKFWNTPYERLSGRTSTIGGQYLDYFFTSGMAGIALDAVYLESKYNL